MANKLYVILVFAAILSNAQIVISQNENNRYVGDDLNDGAAATVPAIVNAPHQRQSEKMHNGIDNAGYSNQRLNESAIAAAVAKTVTTATAVAKTATATTTPSTAIIVDHVGFMNENRSDQGKALLYDT